MSFILLINELLKGDVCIFANESIKKEEIV